MFEHQPSEFWQRSNLYYYYDIKAVDFYDFVHFFQFP